MPDESRKPLNRNTLWVAAGFFTGLAAALALYKRRSACSRLGVATPAVATAGTPAPEPGDILLFHNAKGMNRIITGFTGSPFYHAALYAGDGEVLEATTPGVVRRDLRGRQHDFVVAPAPEGRGKEALAWAETQIGDAYDTMDIAVIVVDRLCRWIHFNYTPNNKYSCGEFVATAFDKAGVRLVPNRDLGDVVPGDLACYVPAAQRRPAH